jgi:hypothetical protein
MTEPRALTIGEPGTAKLSGDGRTMVVSIPIRLRHQKGRKQMMAVDTAVTPLRPTAPARADSTLVKAIVRAHRWRGMLEGGRFKTVRDLAQAEKINESYLCRMLRLMLLSPAITEAILEGTQPPDLELPVLLEKLPNEWEAQAAYIANAAQ